MELATADLSRVSDDVANDILEIIKKGKGEGRISLNQFERLMHEIEVNYSLISCSVRCFIVHLFLMPNHDFHVQFG